jgi:hypothetical protein
MTKREGSQKIRLGEHRQHRREEKQVEPWEGTVGNHEKQGVEVAGSLGVTAITRMGGRQQGS